MRVTFQTCEGVKRGFILMCFPCGHRFNVRLTDGTTRIIDLAQFIRGTGQLKVS